MYKLGSLLRIPFLYGGCDLTALPEGFVGGHPMHLKMRYDVLLVLDSNTCKIMPI